MVNKWFKKSKAIPFTILIVVMLALLFAVACGSAAAPEAAAPEATAPDTAAPKPVPTAVPAPSSEVAVNPGKLTIMVAGWGDEKFDVLNSTSTSFQYAKIVHAFLVDSNEKVELIPGIASDWGISSDGLTWTFTIRDGVKFHDGTDLTAEDVLWTWQHLFGPEALEITTSGTITNMIHKTVKIERTGPDAVSLSTSLPEAPFPFSVSRISPNWMGMMPKRDKPQDEEAMVAYNRDPIATGFMKLVRHVPAEVMEFERFDDYYYQPKHGLPEDRRMKFTFLDMLLVPEEATRVAAMRAGETDIAPVSLEVWPESHWPGFALRQSDVFQSYAAQ